MTAAVARTATAVLAVAFLAGCGATTHGGSGSLPVAAPAPTFTVSPAAAAPAGAPRAVAAATATSLHGTGAYVYRAGGVTVTVTVPPEAGDSLAAAFAAFRAAVHATPVRVVSVTLTGSAAGIDAGRFMLRTPDGTVALRPAAGYLAGWLASATATSHPALFAQGSALARSLPTALRRSGDRTLLVVAAPIDIITGVTYTPPGMRTPQPLVPAWLLAKQAAAAHARSTSAGSTTKSAG